MSHPGLKALLSARPSGGWTPADIPNVQWWFDFSDESSLTFSSGVSISQANDLTGNGNHVSHATSSKQPQWNATANGLTVANFDGGDLLYNASVTAPTTPTTFLAVVSMTLSGNNQRHICSHPTSADYGMCFGGRGLGPSWRMYQGTDASLGTFTSTTLYQVDAVFDGSSSKHAVNGAAWTTGLSVGTKTPQAGLYIGANAFFGSAGGEFWLGRICEVVGIDGSISDADRDEWSTYCTDKWGV